MPSTLAQLEARLSAMLIDATVIFAEATLAESIRNALHEYSRAFPLAAETVITLPGAGHEIALDGLTGLLSVTDVWWPYDSTADESWPPERVNGFQVSRDDARPVLVLPDASDQPQADDEMRVFYTTLHTVQNLDAAAVTSLPPDHESIILGGAAGYALLARAADLAESISPNAYAVKNYQAQAQVYFDRFAAKLVELKTRATAGGPVFGVGYRMDKWDR